jgi:hypothetical protein
LDHGRLADQTHEQASQNNEATGAAAQIAAQQIQRAFRGFQRSPSGQIIQALDGKNRAQASGWFNTRARKLTSDYTECDLALKMWNKPAMRHTLREYFFTEKNHLLKSYAEIFGDNAADDFATWLQSQRLPKA